MGISENFLTEQLAKLKSELTATLNAGIQEVKDSLSSDISKLRLELETSKTDLKKDFDERITALETKLDNEVTKLTLDLNTRENSLKQIIEERFNKLSTDHNALLARIVKNEDHGRKLNLVLRGVAMEEDQPIETAVNNFFTQMLDIPLNTVNEFRYRAVHPLGKPKPNKPQPIIVAFCKQNHRDLVMRSAYKLKGYDEMSIRPNYSKETSMVRDNLMQTRRQLLTAGYKARVTEKKYYPVLEILDERSKQWTNYVERDVDEPVAGGV